MSTSDQLSATSESLSVCSSIYGCDLYKFHRTKIQVPFNSSLPTKLTCSIHHTSACTWTVTIETIIKKNNESINVNLTFTENPHLLLCGFNCRWSSAMNFNSFDWTGGFLRVLTFSISTLEHFTACINLLVCVHLINPSSPIKTITVAKLAAASADVANNKFLFIEFFNFMHKSLW